MEPTSLSATAIKAFQNCPAMYRAMYLNYVRIGGSGGSAGDLGSLLHESLEWWVKNGTPAAAELSAKCRELAPNYGIDGPNLGVALKMLNAFHQRWTDDPPHEVLLAEVKESFPLTVKLPNGQIYTTNVSYIWDRCDRLIDGSIRVVDYKSWMQCMTADEIFADTQVRIYALAAAIRYKNDDPPYIWVALDQLRYGVPTAVRFTRDDIRDIWRWLRGMYTEILLSDGTTERVNPSCRWCVRSSDCASFQRAVEAGTVMSYRTPEQAALKVAEINAVMPALLETKAQLITFLESYLEEQGYLDERFENGTVVKITPKHKRDVVQEEAMDAVGSGIAAQYGKLSLAVIDELLDGDELSDEQKDKLRKAITEGFTTSTNANFVK